MKILMISYEFPPIGGGGSKVVYGLSKELVRLGHKIDLVTMGFRNLPRVEQVSGVNVYRIPCIRRSESVCSTPEMLSYVISAIPKVLKLVRKNKYDLNHTHFIFPDGLISWVVNKLTKLPYVITAHGSDVPGYNPNRFKTQHKLLEPLWKKIAKNAETIISPSASLSSLILYQDPNLNISIIPNGIDVNRLNPKRDKKPRILVTTRMFERKGVQYLLKALNGLDAKCEVNIVGDGPYLGTLKQMAKDLDLDVRFWGWLANTSLELKDLYETSSIFAFPSKVENFAVVLLEAMSAGMAVVTTEGTGCAETIGDTGMLVRPEDPDSIREALKELLAHPDRCKKLGHAARKRLENNFGWTSVGKRYSELYINHSKLSND